MNFKQIIIWILFLVVGTTVLYKFWFISEWQKNRVYLRVGNSKYKKAPGVDNRLLGENGKNFYVEYKLKLLFYSVLFSSIVTGASLYVFYDKEFNNINDYIRVLLSLFTTYFLVLGLRGTDNSTGDNFVTTIVTGFKKKCICPLVDDEWTSYVNYIEDKIHIWYDKEKVGEGCYFGGLIVRLQSDLFDMIIGNDINLNYDDDNLIREYDDSKYGEITEKEAVLRAEIKTQSQNFMRKYIEGDRDMTLITEVNQFLSKCLKVKKMNLYDLVEFINDNEKSCEGKTKEEIIKYMKELINQEKRRVRTVRAKEVENRINELYSTNNDLKGM